MAKFTCLKNGRIVEDCAGRLESLGLDLIERMWRLSNEAVSVIRDGNVVIVVKTDDTVLEFYWQLES